MRERMAIRELRLGAGALTEPTVELEVQESPVEKPPRNVFIHGLALLGLAGLLVIVAALVGFAQTQAPAQVTTKKNSSTRAAKPAQAPRPKKVGLQYSGSQIVGVVWSSAPAPRTSR